MQIFQNIATVISCLSACATLSIAIIKPLRQWVIDSFIHQSQYKQLFSKMNEINEKIDKSLEQNGQLDKRLIRVEKNVLENEADRIRAELFEYGNRCRRGTRLHPEEMDHLRTIFHKYKEVLHQNHDGEAEFDFILDYYNHQEFLAYHTQQK